LPYLVHKDNVYAGEATRGPYVGGYDPVAAGAKVKALPAMLITGLAEGELGGIGYLVGQLPGLKGYP
jgi:hypothetical protein